MLDGRLAFSSLALAASASLLLAAAALGDPVPMPEELLDVEDRYSEEARSPNLLYFGTLAAKPWWSERHEVRIPVLVTETIGMPRRNAPMSLVCELPRGAVKESVRLLTPYGEELPCEVRAVEGQGNRIEVVFILSLLEFEQIPLFVYCGSRPLPQARYPALHSFSLREGRDCYHLENERLKVELDRKTGNVRALIVAGGAGRNQLGEYYSYTRGDGNIGSLGGVARITEDGPVRKTLTYESPEMTSEFSLYRNSSLLYYRLLPKSDRGAHGLVIWTPGGDCRYDRLYYETAKDYFLERRGIKRAKLRYAVSEDLVYYKLPDLKEGWLAFEDQRGEVGGELLLLKDTRNPTLTQHGTGYRVTRSSAGPRRFHGALLAANGNYQTVRKAYISWMNPPVVTLGKPQRKLDAKPKVPVFGEDFVRMHCSSYGGPGGFRRANEHSAEGLVRYISRLGANSFTFSAAEPLEGEKTPTTDDETPKEPREDPFVTKEFVPAARRRGLAIQMGLPEGLVSARGSGHDLDPPSSAGPASASLHSSNVNVVKYYTKRVRGAVGNREPVMTGFSVSAAGEAPATGVSSAEVTRRQMYLQLLWGSNSLCGFGLSARACAGDEALLAARKVYRDLNYSGLGDLLVKAQPVKFVGIMGGRDASPDGTRRGGTTADGGYGRRLDESYVRAMGNTPTDIVFSEHLSSLSEDGYRVLIIPADASLSTASAELIRKYVESGGTVIVEAEGLKNAVIQEVAKVFPEEGVEPSAGQWPVRGTAAPLAELECIVRAKRLPIKNGGAEVLAVCADGTPALTSAKCGKGTIVYTPLRISESLDRPGGPKTALRKLIAHLAGPPPISVVPEDAVAANALINREQSVVVLAVYHHTLRPREDAWINLRPELLGLPEEYEVTEFLSGTRAEVSQDGVVAEMAPHEFRFYVLAAPKRFPLPRSESKPVGGIAYSPVPGMKFLKRLVDQVDGTSSRTEGKPKSLQEIIENLDPEDAMEDDDLDFEE